MSPLRSSIETSPAVLRISMSPVPLMTVTGVAISDTLTSPFSLRIVTEDFLGTEISRSTLMRDSLLPMPVG